MVHPEPGKLTQEKLEQLTWTELTAMRDLSNELKSRIDSYIMATCMKLAENIQKNLFLENFSEHISSLLNKQDTDPATIYLQLQCLNIEYQKEPFFLKNETDGKRWAIIFCAERFDFPLMIETLAKSGCDLNAQTHSGMTPLMLAISQDNQETAKMLVSLNADSTLTTNINQTALHIACAKGNVEMINLLLNNQSTDINAIDLEGRSPLWNALYHSHPKAAMLLAGQDRCELNVSAKGRDAKNLVQADPALKDVKDIYLSKHKL